MCASRPCPRGRHQLLRVSSHNKTTAFNWGQDEWAAVMPSYKVFVYDVQDYPPLHVPDTNCLDGCERLRICGSPALFTYYETPRNGSKVDWELFCICGMVYDFVFVVHLDATTGY